MPSAGATMDVLAAASEAAGGRISAKRLLPEAQAAGSGAPGLGGRTPSHHPRLR